ncbi:DUF5412 domain-containing protein [Bacillaceae bacterium SIJ1]|nr:DUF5412 domain-containing protein [Litoribacterium kuwaitense]
MILVTIFAGFFFHTMFSPNVTFLESTVSPQGEVTIDIYLYEGGAMGSNHYVFEKNGPLWFTKQIYNLASQKQEIEYVWKNNDIMIIEGEEVSVN